jgi:hypothetical protein
MSRAVLRLVLDVVLTIVLALLILGIWQTVLGGLASEGFPEGFRLLFNFMDVGLAVWVIFLIIRLVRTRPNGPSAGGTWVSLLVGAILNLIVVAVVGFIQGGTGPWLVLFAIEAGIAALVAAAIVVPIVHRLLATRPPK